MLIRKIVPWASLLAACAIGGAGCLEEPLADHDEPESEIELEPEGEIGNESAALSPTDPVSKAIGGCTTGAVRGLSTQLVEELNCLRPNTMKRIDKISGIKLGATAFPFLQTPAANALIATRKDRGATMTVVAALRTLPQQYLLYRWYKTGLCGIVLAASPGTSNHESGLAVDVSSNAGWRSYFQSNSYRWYGSKDPPHFTYHGSGVVNIRGLSVRAFQRLWNRNHPEDQIAEDGVYGPSTESRLVKAPSGGFPLGGKCSSVPDASAPDASDDPTEEPFEDAGEPADGEELPDEILAEDDPVLPPKLGAASEEGGCAVSRARSPLSTGTGAVLAVAGLGLLVSRRRQRR